MLTTPGRPGSDDGQRRVSQPADDETWEIPGLPGMQAALDALRWDWGEAYQIGCRDGRWWYRRRDGKGATQSAGTPDERRAQIITDYTLRPVHRDSSPTRTPRPAVGHPTPASS
jgi:hypothetical protein